MLKSFAVATIATLMLAGAAAAQDASAAASPSGQIYRVSFANVDPVFGGSIYFEFDDWGISSYTESGIGGADSPGGTGSWDAEGAAISIYGDAGEAPDPGDPLPPAPAFQLFADGQSQVRCESWPRIEVGASADPQSLCWITSPNVLAVERTQ
ncbi:hypothetical protein [Maricaulis sp.]|uniref:hypothetical protein n=1 Tax=Maricaulis sp. TaxID=1486257 RepID=UPI003A955C3E